MSNKAEHLEDATNVASELSDRELVNRCEGFVRDIALNLDYLRELRKRFEQGPVEGYENWTEFVGKNSGYSLPHIQRLLRGETAWDKVSKDERRYTALKALDKISGSEAAREEGPDVNDFGGIRQTPRIDEVKPDEWLFDIGIAANDFVGAVEGFASAFPDDTHKLQSGHRRGYRTAQNIRRLMM